MPFMHGMKRAIDGIFPWGSDTEEEEELQMPPAKASKDLLAVPTPVAEAGIRYQLLRETSQAGKVLAHCRDCIKKLQTAVGGDMLTIYKIGITHDCEARFQLYHANGWSHMLVMFASDDLGCIEMLEAALISHHRDHVQCRNVLPGGEGMRDACFNPKFASPYYCYCAAARADQPRWVLS